MDVMDYLRAKFNQNWILGIAQNQLGLQMGPAADGVCQELCWKKYGAATADVCEMNILRP